MCKGPVGLGAKRTLTFLSVFMGFMLILFYLSFTSDKRGASAYLKQGCRLALRSACSLTYSILWLAVMGV